tara:strand:- start:580 stop:915 length:336 start_codon:yes stop_codon:yes gene_type:complete
MDHREILQIKKESRDERLRQAIFLGVFIAIYFTAGYFFKLDIKLMMIIGIPVLFLGMMLTDIAHKLYGSMLANTMIIQASTEEIISALKKENESKREEYNDEYDDEEYEDE